MIELGVEARLAASWLRFRLNDVITVEGESRLLALPDRDMLLLPPVAAVRALLVLVVPAAAAVVAVSGWMSDRQIRLVSADDVSSLVKFPARMVSRLGSSFRIDGTVESSLNVLVVAASSPSSSSDTSDDDVVVEDAARDVCDDLCWALPRPLPDPLRPDEGERRLPFKSWTFWWWR